MKFIKKSLLALSLLTLSANTLPHGGGGGFGGGFAAGALTGVAVTSIAASASNRNNGGGDSSAGAIRREIKDVQKEKRRTSNDLKNGKITQKEHDDIQKDLNSQIRDLRQQL